MPTLFSFAFKNIKRKPLRTGILMFAIALLASALVFSLSFVQRVNGSIRKSSERLGADLLVVHPFDDPFGHGPASQANSSHPLFMC